MTNRIFFDRELVLFFEEMKGLSKIIDLIFYRSDSLKKVGDFIKKESNDTISFIPKSKLSLEHTGFSEIKYRTSLKIGRFVNKFFDKRIIADFQVSDYDIEIFVNLYKSYFSQDYSKLKIVEGDDILKYYLEENYYQPSGARIGTLWNSCMRYREKNKYMRIYSKNPDQVKMLVLFGDDGKIKTRALLWDNCKDVDGNVYKVMDRIYSVFDYDMVFFKKWAFENGYIHKLEQSAKTESYFLTPDGAKKIELIVELKNHILDYYPYMDSFKFYSRKRGTFANSGHTFPYKYILTQNNGGLEPEQEIEPEYEEQDEQNW